MKTSRSSCHVEKYGALPVHHTKIRSASAKRVILSAMTRVFRSFFLQAGDHNPACDFAGKRERSVTVVGNVGTLYA